LKFVFIADFFANQVLGGGEINNEELIFILNKSGCEVKTINSGFVSPDFLEEHKSYNFIIANFVQLSEESKKALLKNKYIIYEHDHKYLIDRNPALFNDFLAPKEAIVNYELYSSAKAILCQSSFHKSIVERNLNLKNIISLGGNLWSEESLHLMEEISKNDKKESCSIMKSNIGHKNTSEAIRFCQAKNLDYELIEDKSYHNFLRKLGSNEKFVFFPKTPETLSRVVVEARMMGCSTITNNLIGATKEPWFEQKGSDLIKIIRKKREEIPQVVVEAFRENTPSDK
tara:strand:- start:557 stop:1414 length:858 start_codon:yes stop_codon:yes gene_type:complete